MIIYMLAGLGFDKRTFQHLNLDKNFEIHHLDWIEPAFANEPIEAYAARMLDQQILPEHRSAEIIFIGHSFGGVMCQELARLVEKPSLVIIISSIRSHSEKPFLMRWFYWMPVFWLLSSFLTWLTVPLWGWLFGYLSVESRRLLCKMVSRFSSRYLSWAARSISKWKPKKAIEGLRVLSLHGSIDLMFPAHLQAQPKKILKGGNHFMVYHRAGELSALINEELNALKSSN
jgi:pimeloyl-ACP methyl ester carboxylesterase